ncbi:MULTISPECIES: PadR family transcriptional regulator [unclassified Microbacterium]|uniref:PadR family transcriptional regulator n=1 Tax=unclassified Microbacterium TaxID=2609290 RepID=UPI00137D6078|nr:PadR family transcriptional regulator [Microbacterium sp. MAH-37]
MTLRHALLGLLEDGHASGYDLTARFEKSLHAYVWTARQSHVYPELNRMIADHLIEVVEQGARGRRTYAITESGRQELRKWLLTPAGPRGVRDERVLRIALISALSEEDARRLILDYLADAEAAEAELLGVASAADAEDHQRGRLRFGRLALEYGIRSFQAQQEWARWALAQLEVATKTSESER